MWWRNCSMELCRGCICRLAFYLNFPVFSELRINPEMLNVKGTGCLLGNQFANT